MHILFLGPQCENIENVLLSASHTIFRTEAPFTVDLLKHQNFDFGISYRFKNIIRKPEIDWFNGKLINLHISYLPWNKGADPNLWSWIDDTPKGVTIHKINEGCDTGDILLQKEVKFDLQNETLYNSYNTLSHEIEKLFIDNMNSLLNEEIESTPQHGHGSFHYSKDKKPFLHLIKKHGWDTPVRTLSKK